MSDRFGEALPGATYHGFSGAPSGAPEAAAPQAQPQPRRESLSRSLMYAGLALAIGTGLAFGLWARPELVDPPRDPPPMKAAVQTPTAAEPELPQIVPVEVLEPTPAPAPKADGPLEVLPADLARRAEAARPIIVRAPVRAPVRAEVRTPARAAAAAAAPAAAIAPAPPIVVATRPPALAPAPRPARDEGPAFDCRLARSPAERLVCGDTELASLDRRLNRAFDQAVSSGIPYRALRREQDDWLNIREDAARHSPEAVASVYRQRIAELNDLAG